MSNDRKRAVNFSTKEEKLLVALAKKYAHILENKMSNVNINNEKVECWAKVEKEFNASSGETFRDRKVLKKKYENIKKRTKKKFADEKCHMQGTGGGPPVTVKIDDVDEEIKEILGSRIEGLPSEFDDDAFEIITEEMDTTLKPFESTLETVVGPPSTSAVVNHINTSMILSEDDENENIDVLDPVTPKPVKTSTTCNWSKYNPQMLQRSKSKVLRVSNKDTSENRQKVNDKVCHWAEAKTRFEEFKIQYAEKEQNLKLKHLEEKHKKEMELLEKESNVRIEFLKQQHKVKLEILAIEKEKIINK